MSFYRSPFSPLPVPPAQVAYYSGPDAAAAYDPQTGLFDVSYAAAWQLGQLLALQSASIASALYQWKRAVTRQQAVAAEDALLTRRLAGTQAFPSVLGPRSAAAAATPPGLPDDVVTWFGSLAGLHGVPFSYLVPDERMLPPESIRFFHLDPNWIDALIDGAFSIGRAAASGHSAEAARAGIRALARLGRRPPPDAPPPARRPGRGPGQRDRPGGGPGPRCPGHWLAAAVAGRSRLAQPAGQRLPRQRGHRAGQPGADQQAVR